MTRAVWQVGGLIVLVLGLSSGETGAQDRTGAAWDAQERRLSLEAAAGLHTYYHGDVQSIALGFAPNRRFTLLISAERSYVRDVVDRYEDGFGFERGGTDTFVSAELRYAFFPNRRVSPYLVGGTGAGNSRSNVTEFFPEQSDQSFQVIYYGAGARMPVRPWLDAYVDGRFTMSLGKSDYLRVRLPVRAGLAWRF
jgi:hypothetical protein